MLKLLSVFALSFLVPSSVAQEFRHQRRIPQRPDRPSVREMVIKKYEMREEVLKQALKHREQALADHKSGRKLMSDEEHVRHLQQVKGIHRKLAGIRNKDKAVRFEGLLLDTFQHSFLTFFPFFRYVIWKLKVKLNVTKE